MSRSMLLEILQRHSGAAVLRSTSLPERMSRSSFIRDYFESAQAEELEVQRACQKIGGDSIE